MIVLGIFFGAFGGAWMGWRFALASVKSRIARLERREKSASEALERANEIQAVGVAEAVRKGLIADPGEDASTTCGCGHNKSYHYIGTGSCQEYARMAGYEPYRCRCQTFVPKSTGARMISSGEGLGPF